VAVGVGRGAVGQVNRMQNHRSAHPPADPAASLVIRPARGTTRAVVLVLNGGKAVSREVSTSTQLSVLRMVPFAWKIRWQNRKQGVAVWRLRYRYRGWNGSEASPVTDARWALDEVRRLHGNVPVVLLGHSMGGRAAAHVAGDPLVRGLVLLAPWLSASDPVRVRADVPVRLVHGDQDRITSASAAAAWGERTRQRGAELTVCLVPGGEHFMLRKLRAWHRLATSAVAADICAALEEPQALSA
jgi:alpha-beta hydrolase superfamily lysophospholipase